MKNETSRNFSGRHERAIVWLLCFFAAVHVFVFSAAFPLFNNTDEPMHFDLVMKYSQTGAPRALDPLSPESLRYIVLFSTSAYFENPTNLPNGQFPPPPWTQSAEKIRQALLAVEKISANLLNYECSQPPLYYALGGLWWRLGQWCGFENGYLLYWLRFMNIPLVGLLVWLGYAAAKLIFPEERFIRLGVTALLAFIPQTSFYSIQNDLMSSLCFGAAFICVAHFLKAEIPGVRLGAATGLALAATYLTKAVNIPLIAVAMLVVSLKILRLIKAGNFRAALPSLISLALCAGLPMEIWMFWCERNFGDLTGSTVNIRFWGVTAKPFGEWWHHPIFTPHGSWTFVSDLLSRFWQGEFLWHGQPMTFRAVDVVYVFLTIGLVALAVANLCSRSATATGAQRQALWFGFSCFITLVFFWGFQSIIYNFALCPAPTPKYPYFATGRYLLGMLIPFLLLFVYGIDRALKKSGDRAKFLALAGMILFMLVSEIATDWPVFSSQYNWFHL